ncbi:uncharacterized protein LOC132600488 [Lycium barbarum]|uniref:uncharacterized protein LOC132600488 n=1 Tax=Lycium barbarum TaxID=112863 RepID=UPI00293EA185|nr:uncharacterized protein LOC132600488 [Lycium barbarum]
MQCTNYLPGYYYPRDHVFSLTGSNSRSIPHSGIAWNSSRGFNLAFPPFMVDQSQDLVYQKDILRQTILKHEATFRYQVNELHRLYGRQRELMDEIKRRKQVDDHVHLQELEPNTFVSLLRSEISEKTFRHSVNLTIIEPYAPSKEMFQESFSFGADKTVQPGVDCLSGKNILNECTASLLKNDTSRKRMLDLELPAEKAIDNEEENPVKRINVLISEFQPQRSSKVKFVASGDSSSSPASYRGTFLLFDLNEPAQPFESECPNSAFGSNNIHEEIQDRDLDLSGIGRAECSTLNKEGRDGSNFKSFDEDNKFSDYTNCRKGMDLNLTPPTYLSDYRSAPSSDISHLNFPEGGNVEIHKNYEVLDSKMVPDSSPEYRKCTRDNHLVGTSIDSKLSTTNICIDLNSCIKEDLLSSSPSEATKSTGERDLEGPVSPENKECSPPRGDSQDSKVSTSIYLPGRGHNDPIEEFDKVAADILIFISSSAKSAIGEPSEASRHFLGQLAEVASSLSSCPENEVEQPMEKEKGIAFCNQPRRGQARRRKKDQKDLQTDVVPAVGSLLHQMIAPKSGPWKKTPSGASSRGGRWSNDGERTTFALLLQHTLDNKHGITGRFLKGWGVTKRRQRARRAQSYVSPLFFS